MKKSVILSSIISLVAILLVTVFGVYALLMANQTRTSQVVLHVIDQNVNVIVKGEAEWVPEGDDKKNFTTQTNSDGFVDKVWDMHDLELTQLNTEVPANLRLSIHNNNQNEVYRLKVLVEGLALDKNDRFATFVTCICDDNIVSINQRITELDPSYEIIVEGTTKDIDLTFAYRLLQINSTFSINQEINVTVSTEPVEEEGGSQK